MLDTPSDVVVPAQPAAFRHAMPRLSCHNGGMGSFYRSKHELILCFKAGTKSHTNNVELGRHGRNRTNVWEYAGVNTFRAGRLDELAMHPTVKPVALIADAIKDASRRSNIVLDPFCGSGSTLIARRKPGVAGMLLKSTLSMSMSPCDAGSATAGSRRDSMVPTPPLRRSRNSEALAHPFKPPRTPA